MDERQIPPQFSTAAILRAFTETHHSHSEFESSISIVFGDLKYATTPSFDHQPFGYRNFAHRIWFDDIASTPSQIGCMRVDEGNFSIDKVHGYSRGFNRHTASKTYGFMSRAGGDPSMRLFDNAAEVIATIPPRWLRGEEYHA
jgi:hypothetical protein